MRIEKTFHFLAGLPRSGSTVLQSILNQNPKIYVSSTSPLMGLLCQTELAWNNSTEAKASGVAGQLDNIYKGVINGCYAHIDRPIIIDKNRGWVGNIAAAKSQFDDVRCICTVRDIPSILASFINIISAQDPEFDYLGKDLKNLVKPDTIFNRCEILWHRYIKETYQALKFVYENNREFLLIIDYDDLVRDHDVQLKRIYEFLGEDSFAHSFSDIKNITPEKDEFWSAIGLHDIRPELKKTSVAPEEILGMKVFEHYRNLKLEFWK